MPVVDTNDCERLFLQAMLARSCVTEHVMRQLVEDCNKEYDMSYTQEEMIQNINNNIRDLALKLSSLKSEENGLTYWCLINVQGDDIMKFSSKYSSKEIEFFDNLIRCIVGKGSADGVLEAREAINIKLTHKITNIEKEAALEKFVQDFWLETFDSDSKFCLGPRSLLELSAYISSKYSDMIASCELCKSMTFRGYQCPNEGCKAFMHRHCATFYQKSRKAASPACCTCQTPYK